MKCLSLIQPFASLVACGSKSIESRSWSTPYRGPLAIHASKGFPKAYSDLCEIEPFYSEFSRLKLLTVTKNEDGVNESFLDYSVFPLGAVVATCRLVRIEPITEDYWETLSFEERAFGNYTTPGRWAWILEDIVRLEPAVPARGSLNLWEWDHHG